jgi:serine/threonine-protein kinase
MTSTTSLIGTTIGNTYRIERLIGEGGMGAVYAAKHLRLPTTVAVKTLLIEGGTNPEVQARFRREAEITSTLRHPNIVQVTDFNVLDDGTPYLVMELLEGEDLHTRLQRVGKLPLEEALKLVRAVGAGLAAAHKRDIVHRDLKPQNIFMARQGDGTEIPKIVDFGISKIQHNADTMMRTRENMLIGTPNYMSPEQARGKNSEVDGRTDQWALATIAYQCLTGKVAFVGDSLADVIYQVVAVEPPPVYELAPDVPPPLVAALTRALAKTRDERFPTISDFVQSLDTPLPKSQVPAVRDEMRSAVPLTSPPPVAVKSSPPSPHSSSPAISAGAEGSAVTGMVLNILLPGVGSLVAGRKGVGAAQLILWLVGLALIVKLIGIPIVIGAWIWSLATGISLLGAKGKQPST